MKTADEVAEEIRWWLNNRYMAETNDDIQEENDYIAQVLTVYAEERINEAMNDVVLGVKGDMVAMKIRAEAWADAVKRFEGLKEEGIKIGRAEALKESANLCASYHGPMTELVEQIRALKTTTPEGEHGGKPMDSPGIDIWEKP